MRNGEYELIIAPNEYPGKKYRDRYIYEHHFVWWNNTGITIPAGYSIHHINENKRDNRFENLELISNKTHASLHKKEKETIPLVCTYCGAAFVRDLRNFKWKKENGQINFYCCRSHQVRHQHALKNSPVA